MRRKPPRTDRCPICGGPFEVAEPVVEEVNGDMIYAYCACIECQRAWYLVRSKEDDTGTVMKDAGYGDQRYWPGIGSH